MSIQYLFFCIYIELYLEAYEFYKLKNYAVVMYIYIPKHFSQTYQMFQLIQIKFINPCCRQLLPRQSETFLEFLRTSILVENQYQSLTRKSHDSGSSSPQIIKDEPEIGLLFTTKVATNTSNYE